MRWMRLIVIVRYQYARSKRHTDVHHRPTNIVRTHRLLINVISKFHQFNYLYVCRMFGSEPKFI